MSGHSHVLCGGTGRTLVLGPFQARAVSKGGLLGGPGRPDTGGKAPPTFGVFILNGGIGTL